MDHIGLDCQIVADEFGRIRAVGMDAPHLGGGKEHIIRSFLLEESLNRGLPGEIDTIAIRSEHIATTVRQQATDDRATHQAAMTSNIDFCVIFHCGTST
jgi:hypothetical protein